MNQHLAGWDPPKVVPLLLKPGHCAVVKENLERQEARKGAVLEGKDFSRDGRGMLWSPLTNAVNAGKYLTGATGRCLRNVVCLNTALFPSF